MNRLNKKGAWIVEVLACLLVFLWVYTAVSKLASAEEFRAQLANQVFKKGFTEVLFFLLPTVELMAAVLLCWRSFRLLGFGLSLLLMLAFTGYVGLILIGFFPRVPCSCGGVLKVLGWKSHFVFNLFFTAVAAIGYIFTYKERRWVSVKT
ncbi:MauE/DoxX family redox-associated membrane protein [Pedobacter nutrimenti]|uniref:MauE/DoxX family redox-associated membrane protein n=1 Tax=Pedobacter nutrimenti TaxID=1241337 RepID=UPI00292D5BD4|nr:MauE/DoxX family redox-associated membrane protein [Pedobacter nutrimenti]